MLFYPTAIAWHKNAPAEEKRAQAAAWELVQRGHAVANGCFVYAVNRVGRERELDFWGRSFVAGPFGEIIAQAGAEEEILLAKCNLEQLDVTRRHWPFLRDRRVDAYGGLLERFGSSFHA
jgi:N-carbamoylputrescine amidase